MRSLSKTKEQMSKIRNTHHKKLNLFKYLELNEINSKEAKAVFAYRSRMANFGHNYKGNNPYRICPLCYSHPDKQEWSFRCSVIKENINIQGNYDDLIEGNISKNLAKTILAITKLRESLK